VSDKEYSFTPVGAAVRRRYFDPDTHFSGDRSLTLILAYEEACEKAESTARYAVKEGTLEAIRIAQWHEAIAQTIEELLAVFPHGLQGNVVPSDLSFELPDPPEFS
jgi:hypothetical protein